MGSGNGVREDIQKVKRLLREADNFNKDYELRSFETPHFMKMGDSFMIKSQYREYRCEKARVENFKTFVLLLLCSCVLLVSSGCGNKFWDPTQVGRFRPVPAVNVILDSLGVADETPADVDVES